MISGHGLNEQGQKISKRELGSAEAGFNRYLPDHVLDRYGADALRLWATKARVGTDLRYHEKDVRAGRKLAVKLWNVARFLTRHEAGPDPRLPVESLTPVDRWLLSHLTDALDTATGHLDDYDATAAYQATARFFWSIYCDRYLEMIKGRFLDGPDETGAASARTTLWASFRVVLGMFAPFAPFVTEELYQRLYRAGAERAGDDAPVSLHLPGWPRAEPRWRGDRGPIDQLAKVLDRVRALRSGLRLGSGTRLDTLVLHPTTPVAAELAGVIAEPLRVAARADQVIFGEAAQDSGVPGLAVALRVRSDR
jgi:valyl-tRNA synthetase